MRIVESLHEPGLLIYRVMHAVGRAKACAPTVCCLLFVVLDSNACFMASGVTVMYTCSFGAQVQTLFMRCLNVGSWWQSSKHLDTTRNYQQTSGHHQLPAKI